MHFLIITINIRSLKKYAEHTHTQSTYIKTRGAQTFQKKLAATLKF